MHCGLRRRGGVRGWRRTFCVCRACRVLISHDQVSRPARCGEWPEGARGGGRAMRARLKCALTSDTHGDTSTGFTSRFVTHATHPRRRRAPHTCHAVSLTRPVSESPVRHMSTSFHTDIGACSPLSNGQRQWGACGPLSNGCGKLRPGVPNFVWWQAWRRVWHRAVWRRSRRRRRRWRWRSPPCPAVRAQ